MSSTSSDFLPHLDIGLLQAANERNDRQRMQDLEQIRILDLKIFQEVCRAKSIREVARRLSKTSGQISKNIQLLEKKVGFRLFKRSASGVLLTDAGTEFLKLVAEILDGAEKIDRMVAGGKAKAQNRVLAFASTSFLTTHLVAPTVSSFRDLESAGLRDTSFRFLDLAPDQLVASALRGAFEVAIHFGKQSWPGTWESQSIGKSRWVLTMRRDHPLRTGSSLEKILEYPFVLPTYWTAEGLVRGNDQFPIPISKRSLGSETATADAAIPILLATNQIAFLPEVLVQNFVGSKLLKVIPLKSIGEADVFRELFLTVRTDLVSSRFQQTLLKEFRNTLSWKPGKAGSKNEPASP